MAPATRREALLDATERLIQREGVNALTLDAVAAEARVSKGGLLYHFESKEGLVKALVDRLVARFEERVNTPQRFVEAYVGASVRGDPRDDATAAGLVAAIAVAPALLDPLRARYAEWEQRLAADCGDPTKALLIRLALDGLWLSDLLHLAPPEVKARRDLARMLLGLAGAAAPVEA
jgi:AcrR family transcriptional regulator